MKMKERRLVRVVVSFELLRDMMGKNYKTPGIIKNVKGLPDDAIMVSDGFDSVKQVAYFFFFHESFGKTPYGTVIPEVPIVHSIDYTASDLLRKWYEGLGNLRARDDAILDAIVSKELDEVSRDTYDYLENLFK